MPKGVRNETIPNPFCLQTELTIVGEFTYYIWIRGTFLRNADLTHYIVLKKRLNEEIRYQ
ncbi:hypothetical protein UB32_16685 [Mesobacillus subterraneus]|uniref:Uncharacterized protein n=1 Tax=Mesobacillus subterraneus TaxID=285983 RepID=A0A0D6Z6H9_9BACI|nr:hypothetical protein UB32_16685 [Mesobacillus subterraneus]